MKKLWFLRFRSQSGSVTAETAISIAFIVFAGFVLISCLGFAMQFQRLQTLAQESSRTAASLENPLLLETQIKDLLHGVNPKVSVKFDWQTQYVTVVLSEPTSGLVNILKKEIEIAASAPRWSG
jgi:hypothetical protein